MVGDALISAYSYKGTKIINRLIIKNIYIHHIRMIVLARDKTQIKLELKKLWDRLGKLKKNVPQYASYSLSG